MESEIGRVVSVWGRNTVKIAVKREMLPLVAGHGTYVKMEGVDGSTLYALTVGYYMSDENYLKSGIIEEIEGYSSFARTRNEVVAKIVGYLEKDAVRKGVKAPPMPGGPVFLASDEELDRVMGRGEVELGVLSSNMKSRFTLDLNMLASRHLAVLAMTGAGKSNTVAVLLAEIVRRLDYPRILVVDTHSEYVPLKSLYPDKIHVYAPSGKISLLLEKRYGIEAEPLEIPLWTLGFEEVAGLLGLDSRATKQRLHLRNILRRIRASKWELASADDPVFFSLNELRKGVEEPSGRGKSDKSLEDLVLKLESMIDNPDLDFITRTESDVKAYEEFKEGEPERSGKAFVEVYRRLLRPGVDIVALGGLPSEVQAATVSTLLKALWRIASAYAQAGSRLPTLILVEEAHVYASAFREQPSKQILEKIAKEGRKFGVGLIIVSQRPRELSQTLLAQCGTLIALRTSNPEDQRQILRSMEDIMEELVTGLSGLSVGEAIVSGPAAPLPAVVKIHYFKERYGVELGGKDVDWVSEWSRKPSEEDIIPYLYARTLARKEGKSGANPDLTKFLSS